MKIYRITFIVFLTFLSLSFAEAASFDCRKASTRIEKTICSDAGLNDLDNQLGSLYREVRNSIGNSYYADLFVGESKKWLKERNRCRNRNCIRQKYHNRIAQLQSMLPQPKRKNTMKTMQIPQVSWGACMLICEDNSFCKNADHDRQSSVCTLRINTNHPDYRLIQKRCSHIPLDRWGAFYQNDRWQIGCSR